MVYELNIRIKIFMLCFLFILFSDWWCSVTYNPLSHGAFFTINVLYWHGRLHIFIMIFEQKLQLVLCTSKGWKLPKVCQPNNECNKYIPMRTGTVAYHWNHAQVWKVIWWIFTIEECCTISRYQGVGTMNYTPRHLCDVITCPCPQYLFLVQYCVCVHCVNALMPERNGQFADIFKGISFRKRYCISLQISMKFVSNGAIGNNSALVQVMAWCRPATSHYLNQFWIRSFAREFIGDQRSPFTKGQ